MKTFVDYSRACEALLRPLALAAGCAGVAVVPNAAAQQSPPLAEVEALGTGTSGAAGIPELKVLGYEALDQPGAGLRLTHGAPGAPAQIVLSLSQGPTRLPTYGARLWPAAPFMRWTTVLDAHGASPVFASGPAATPAALTGMDIVVQGLVIDAAAQGGAAFTAGARVHVGAGFSAARLFPFASYSIVPDDAFNAGHSLDTGDLDGNGRPDMVFGAGTGANSSVCVLRQLADGTFAPPLKTSLGGKPASALAIADVTDDGVLDVVLVSASTDSLVLLPGLGNGLFGAPQVISAPGVELLAIGDVTGDGLPDLVGTSWFGDVVGVLPRVPGGGFGALILLPVTFGETAFGVSLADADGDGKLDVMLARHTALVVLRSLGGGAFAPEQTTPVTLFGAGAFAVGDLDGDGAPDAVFGGGVSTQFTKLVTLLNDGSGAFPAAVTYTDDVQAFSLPPASLAIADLDGDGQGEVLVQGAGGGFAWSLQHLGNGTLGDKTYIPVTTTVLAPADMNGDGAIDLPLEFAAANGTGTLASVVLGVGDGTFVRPPLTPDFAAFEIATADLDGDGDLDLVGRVPVPGTAFDQTLAVVLGDGHGAFSAPLAVDPGGLVKRFAVGDADGDAFPDVVVTLDDSAQFTVLHGLGGGAFAAPEFHAVATPEDVALADVTHDGRLDVVITQDTAGLSVFPALPGGGFGAPTQTSSGGQTAQRLLLGDVDGDGNLDAIAVGDHTLLFLGTGGAAFVPAVLIPPTQNHSGLNSPVALGDLDGDGDLDLVEGTFSSKGTVMAFNDGAGHFTESPDVVKPSLFTINLTIADVNGDGAADIVGGFIRLGFGDGTFTEPMYGGADGVAGDFDGDGDLDFAGVGGLFFNTLY